MVRLENVKEKERKGKGVKKSKSKKGIRERRNEEEAP